MDCIRRRIPKRYLGPCVGNGGNGRPRAVLVDRNLSFGNGGLKSLFMVYAECKRTRSRFLPEIESGAKGRSLVRWL